MPASSLEEGVCALLRRPDWPAAWRAPLEEPLVENARMEFTRLAAEFRRGDLAVEVCYDQGWIEAGGKRAPIGECELELKQGAEKEFLALVDQLQQALENDSTDGIPSLIRHSWLKASCLELEIMDTVRRQQKILFPADH